MGAVARQLFSAGFTTLVARILSGNTRARAFYEALGGEFVDEESQHEGAMVPEAVCRWSATARLMEGGK
ncbi:MAG: hypothetical protein M3014_01065 [Chloroflexota bacterium]|nr:hypothetical protein [Chloroflexota bacterium]